MQCSSSSLNASINLKSSIQMTLEHVFGSDLGFYFSNWYFSYNFESLFLYFTFFYLPIFPFFSPLLFLLCNFFVQCIHSYYSFFSDVFNLLNPFPYSWCNFPSPLAFKLYKSSLCLSAARLSYIYEYNWRHSSCQKMMPRGRVWTSVHIWRHTFLSLVYSPLKAKSQNREHSLYALSVLFLFCKFDKHKRVPSFCFFFKVQ